MANIMVVEGAAERIKIAPASWLNFSMKSVATTRLPWTNVGMHILRA